MNWRLPALTMLAGVILAALLVRPGTADPKTYGTGEAGLAKYASYGFPVEGIRTAIGLPEGQCVWFVARVVPRAQLPFNANDSDRIARNWFPKAQTVPRLRTGKRPALGAIVCMGSYKVRDLNGQEVEVLPNGHVAVVLNIDPQDGHLMVSDANWSQALDGQIRIHPLDANHAAIQGYIYRPAEVR